jgi:serine/threonine-protein kinase
MADNTQVFGLLEEILDSGKTPEEVCRDCPELLPEVRQRWLEFGLIDAQIRTCLPWLETRSDSRETAQPSTELPQVPGYEIEAAVGRGGMGVVYKARHLALKRSVALKMLAAGHPNSIERARFRAEAEAVARLQHPNIVQIHEVGEVDGSPFFALEYVSGGSLAERLAGKPLPPRGAAGLVATLAEAMHFAHSRNLVHRDLKPANILLAEVGGQESGARSQAQTAAGRLLTPDSCVLTPKITDFGLVRQLDVDSGQTFDGVVIGTPSYMAPEQAEGRARFAGPAADVYALGAILYECLTGEPPFQGLTPLGTLEKVRSLEPAAPSSLERGVPRDLETICLKCLRKDPEQRYSSARELADDLGRFVRGEPVAARPVGAAERLRKWVWRRPAAAGLLGAVVLLMAAGGVGAWLLYQRSATARDRQAQTDRDVRGVLERAMTLLANGWQEADLMILTEAAAEGNRANSMAHSGDASAPVQEEIEAFQDEAKGRLEQAENNRTLLKALLDVSAPQETVVQHRDQAVGTVAPTQPSVDKQYAAAFHSWGLDVDGTSEDEMVARLGVQPDVVVQELIAALDGWMLERRRQKRPEAEWRRLFRLADQLDRNGQHRGLRVLLAGGSPPRPESVAGLVGEGALPWAALWELARGADWRQLQALRGEINPASGPVMTAVLLAQACAAVGDSAGAEQVLRQAAATRPDQVVLLDALGKLLERQGASRRGKAIEYYRAARAQRPGLGIALSAALVRAGRADEAEEVLNDLTSHQPDNAALYNILGISLFTQEKFGAAEAAYRKATELRPDLAISQYNLGLALASQRRPESAEAAYRKAIELKPDYAEAYNNLGRVLQERQKSDAAEAAYRKAIDLQPDLAVAYNNLGIALRDQKKLDEAVAACRKAIEINQDDALAYNSLGVVLHDQKKQDEALAAYRKAIDLKPDFAEAYYNLGIVQFEQKELDQAVAAYRKAIELKPNYADVLSDLGAVLCDFFNKPLEAEAFFLKAIELNPQDWQAHFNLGVALFKQAKFQDAQIPLQQGVKLLPDKDPRRARFDQWIKACDRFLELEARLAAVLQGMDRLASAGEQMEFAQLCNLKQLYAAAAHFYADAFTVDPKLAEAVPEGARFYAACAAAQAGCAHGRDKDTLDDKERSRWRRQAREWLRQDLTWWSKAQDNGNAQTKADVRWRMQYWQADRDLAGLRDPMALEELSRDERKECLALWQEVAVLLSRVQSLK